MADSTYDQKLAALNTLKSQISSIQNIVNSKANALAQQESLLRQGQLPNNNPRNLEKNMSKNVGPMLAPGNLGDINKVIWPYYFTTDVPTETVGPNETFLSGFSVTQEASFIMMSFSKAIYIQDANDADKFTYCDPNDNGQGYNSAPGLSMTIVDASSTRNFSNTPINLSSYGNPRFVTKLPRPILFMPNQTVQISFVNSHPSNVYLPIVSVFGYRMRIEDAQNFLGLVYG